MKIIPYLSEEQIKYLFETYNSDNIKKLTEGRKRHYYFIPKEFIIKPFISRYQKLIPGVEDENNWVGVNALNSVLWECGEIGIQEYFDLLVLHISDTDNRPECPVCKKELTFKSMKQGYGNHPYTGKELWFCSNQCCVSYQLDHPELAHGGFRSFEGNIEAKRTRFLTTGSLSAICTFYIARHPNGIKYGITSDIVRRSTFAYVEGSNTQLRPIVEGRRDFIANLEANIKYDLDEATEFLPWDLVPKFIEVFGKVLIKLRSLSNQ